MPMPTLLDFRTHEFDAALAALPSTSTSDADAAHDEAYWDAVRGLHHQSDALINLENGFWGAMAEPVKAMFSHWTDRLNRETTLLVRPHWQTLQTELRERVATAMGGLHRRNRTDAQRYGSSARADQRL